MKLSDLSAKFSFKYATDGDEKSPVVTDFSSTTPPVVADKTKNQEMVALIIQHCEENGLYGAQETDYLHSLLTRGESPKHILTLIKGRIDAAQAKLNNCKVMLRDWGKLLK